MAIQALSGINTTGTRITNLPSPVSGSEPATKDFASSADNLASGTLAVARGGTGTGTYTNGQILVGQTSGNTLSKVAVSGAVLLSNAGTTTINPEQALNWTGTSPASVGTTPGTDGQYGIQLIGSNGGNTTIATTGLGGGGAGVMMLPGDGGSSVSATTSATGGVGGQSLVYGGSGGGVGIAGTGTNTGGTGGAVTITTGRGGHATGSSSGANTGGTGGLLTLAAGNGGNAITGSGTLAGGTGGAIAVTAGTGGSGTSGGNGGAITITAGAAAATAAAAGGTLSITSGAGSSTGSGGNGGAITITAASAGGNQTANRGGGAITIQAGTSRGSTAGAAISVTSGTGGTGTGTTGANGGSQNLSAGTGGAGSTLGGDGGAFNIAAGTGGTGGTTAGDGGALNLKGGVAGAATGVGGDITLQVAASTTLVTKLRIDSAAGQVQITNSDFKLGTYHTISSAGTSARTLTLPDATTTVVGHDTTQTLTNKRITKRVQSVTNAATITPNADSDDAVDITAIAQAFTIANPSGTPTNFQDLRIRIKDNGTARGITWGSGYAAGGVALPTTTVLSKILTIGFIYNTANSLNKWQCVASAQEA